MENQEEELALPLPETIARNSAFTTSPVEILNALISSKEEGLAIAICSPAFSTPNLITCVEDICIEDGTTMIVLKQYDSTGYMLPSNRINLDQIQSVCLFSSPFSNPFLSNLDKSKTWFF